MADSPHSIKLVLLHHRYFLLLLAAYFVLATVMLEKYPRVWVDEPWESITAYTLGTKGKMYNPVLENYSGFDKVLLQPRLLLSLALAPAFALLGVGHVEGRLVSGVFGALLMLAVYLIATKFFSRRAALISVWFVTIETMMFIAYRTIRPEIFLVTLECFSLFFFFIGLRNGLVRYFFWSGLLSGIALWTHPNALLHVLALSFLLLITYRTRVFTSRYSWTYFAATFVGVLPYLVYVVANDAQNSFSTFFLQLDNRTTALRQQNWFLASFAGEWNRIVEYAQFPYRVPILLILAFAWLFSMFSKSREARNVAIVVAIHAILSFLIISNKTVLYSTSILPLLCILAAVGIDELLGESRSMTERFKNIFRLPYWRESIAVGLFVLLSLNQTAGDLSLLWRNRNCSYTETVHRLQSVIPAHARVWGSLTFWFGFHQQPYRSQYTYLREVESFKPEYMITGDPEVWGKDFWLPVRDKANKIISERGTLLAEIPADCYGTLRVYRLQW